MGDDGGVRVLQRDAPDPLHAQIAAQLRDLVTSRVWPPHHRVPPEVRLAEQLGVARGTLRKAVRQLVDEGLLVQVQGRGTFVTSRGLSGPVEHDLLSLADALTSSGIRADTQVLARASVPASAAQLEQLELAPGSQVRLTRLERLRTADGSPVGFFVNLVREDLCPDLDDSALVTRSLYELVERAVGRRVAQGRRTFAARAAGVDMAERLEVPVGEPLQWFEQVTYLDDGRAVELSEVWVRSDRVRLTTTVSGRR